MFGRLEAGTWCFAAVDSRDLVCGVLGAYLRDRRRFDAIVDSLIAVAG